MDHLYLPPLLRNFFSSNPDLSKAAWTPTSRIEGDGSTPPLEQSRNLNWENIEFWNLLSFFPQKKKHYSAIQWVLKKHTCVRFFCDLIRAFKWDVNYVLTLMPNLLSKRCGPPCLTKQFKPQCTFVNKTKPEFGLIISNQCAKKYAKVFNIPRVTVIFLNLKLGFSDQNQTIRPLWYWPVQCYGYFQTRVYWITLYSLNKPHVFIQN